MGDEDFEDGSLKKKGSLAKYVGPLVVVALVVLSIFLIGILGVQALGNTKEEGEDVDKQEMSHTLKALQSLIPTLVIISLGVMLLVSFSGILLRVSDGYEEEDDGEDDEEQWGGTPWIKK